MNEFNVTHTNQEQSPLELIQGRTDEELSALIHCCQNELGNRAIAAATQTHDEPTTPVSTETSADTSTKKRPATISEWREELDLPRDVGLRRRQLIRRFERWFKDTKCKYIVIDGALLDSMPTPNVVALNAFYTPDDGQKPKDADIYVMQLGGDD